VSHDDDDEYLAVVTSRREVGRMFVPVRQTTRCNDADDPSPVCKWHNYELLSRFVRRPTAQAIGVGVGGIAIGLICLLTPNMPEGNEENYDKSQLTEIQGSRVA